MSNEPSKFMKKKNTIDKMTNLEALLAEDCDTARDPRLVALLAMHLITQVLDEAYVIANAAKESGQPWRCLSLLKSLKSNRSDSFDEDISFEASKGDSVNENKIELVANIVATSTPQKLATKHLLCSADQPINITMNDLIGQGDEDIETRSYELTKSTSMFINNLFDMSEVEHIVISNDTEIIDNDNDFFVDVTNKIESHVTNIVVPLEELPVEDTEEIMEEQEVTVVEKVFDGNISESSFVVDAFVEDIGRDVAFFIDEIVSGEQNEVCENLEVIEETKTVEESSPRKETTENDVQLFESAFLTLNRDYDQCSDEDGFPVLQDPKEMILQEVELLTANTSQDNLSLREPKQNVTEVTATVSGVSGSHKSSLVRRCRLQGARLLACIRGWWRRNAPGKRKQARHPGALKGTCPLSPAARRRSSSFVDNRRSPSPSQPVAWKFNTVNEAVVNSNRWNEYTFDTNLEEFQ